MADAARGEPTEIGARVAEALEQGAMREVQMEDSGVSRAL
jgi:hypothetical protein